MARRCSGAVRARPAVRYVWVEDGPGRPLGRSFRVKLWPNLVFLHNGHILAQMARPTPQEMHEGFALLDRSAQDESA